jgi:predicted transcriptional regulator
MNSLPEHAPAGVLNLELSDLDLRYEGYRLRQPGREEQLLAAIAQEGIREPLLGVTHETTPIVLDGFKRCRCARTLHLHVVPFASWGGDEVAGILKLLRADRQHALSLLEQARFVDELHTQRGLSVAEIAHHLGRSKAWVSLRLGLLQELSPVVREALFAGAFPVYSYLYTLRPFRRLKAVRSADLDQFVGALRGQQLSVRQIEGLAHGFFRGPESFRQELLQKAI